MLYYADSHVNIYRPEIYNGISDVYNFDAHHDAGYVGSDLDRQKRQDAFIERGQVTCEDWAVAFQLLHEINVTVLYPKWKTWAMTGEPNPAVDITRIIDIEEMFVNKNFHRIFVCRSGGWSPSWLDDQFDQFIAACPVATKINLDGMVNRQWDQKRLEEETAMQIKVREEWEKHKNAGV